ncbi:hypothetical protein CVV43_03515 [Candidatus Saccharibacteria bacterium HGW-Saccharibacteria-1]|jgi:GDP-4-dehydro-6-deoxy-D-mannose reductase|nr:MAG: hypothetical protein CVV43_03515 [Candidatus Saccharibacteria bacterium HGW-Saccharibacteria-1]
MITKKERVVVSGVNGFVGYHLVKELYRLGLSIIGVGTQDSVNNNIIDFVEEYIQADLVQEWPSTKNIKAVIHLAGLAAVGPSFDNPQLYINANSAMVTNLCEYYAKQSKKPRILIVSSGAIYDQKQNLPINEDGLIKFNSPYVVSKVLVENQAEYYRNRGLDCIIARPFNHIGPGQNEGFILPDFYNRLSSLKPGESTIVTGNVETSRDYTDVRDIVKAYAKIISASKLENNLYNICSGNSISGLEILNKIKKTMNLSSVSYTIDTALVRPTDTKIIVGNSTRLKKELGWEPQIDIDQTIIDFVNSKR